MKLLINYNFGESYMKGDVYYGKGIRELKDSHPDLFDLVSNINETVWDGKGL